MLIIKPQKTVLIKHLIQGFVMNRKNPTPPLSPFLQNDCNNISFHPHTQHTCTSHCSEERRRVVFPGSFSRSYSPLPVNGRMEYLMLNTTVRSYTNPTLHSLTQPLRIGEKTKNAAKKSRLLPFRIHTRSKITLQRLFQ